MSTSSLDIHSRNIGQPQRFKLVLRRADLDEDGKPRAADPGDRAAALIQPIKNRTLKDDDDCVAIVKNQVGDKFITFEVYNGIATILRDAKYRYMLNDDDLDNILKHHGLEQVLRPFKDALMQRQYSIDRSGEITVQRSVRSVVVVFVHTQIAQLVERFAPNHTNVDRLAKDMMQHYNITAVCVLNLFCKVGGETRAYQQELLEKNHPSVAAQIPATPSNQGVSNQFGPGMSAGRDFSGRDTVGNIYNGEVHVHHHAAESNAAHTTPLDTTLGSGVAAADNVAPAKATASSHDTALGSGVAATGRVAPTKATASSLGATADQQLDEHLQLIKDYTDNYGFTCAAQDPLDPAAFECQKVHMTIKNLRGEPRGPHCTPFRARVLSSNTFPHSVFVLEDGKNGTADMDIIHAKAAYRYVKSTAEGHLQVENILALLPEGGLGPLYDENNPAPFVLAWLLKYMPQVRTGLGCLAAFKEVVGDIAFLDLDKDVDLCDSTTVDSIISEAQPPKECVFEVNELKVVNVKKETRMGAGTIKAVLDAQNVRFFVLDGPQKTFGSTTVKKLESAGTDGNELMIYAEFFLCGDVQYHSKELLPLHVFFGCRDGKDAKETLAQLQDLAAAIQANKEEKKLPAVNTPPEVKGVPHIVSTPAQSSGLSAVSSVSPEFVAPAKGSHVAGKGSRASEKSPESPAFSELQVNNKKPSYDYHGVSKVVVLLAHENQDWAVMSHYMDFSLQTGLGRLQTKERADAGQLRLHGTATSVSTVSKGEHYCYEFHGCRLDGPDGGPINLVQKKGGVVTKQCQVESGRFNVKVTLEAEKTRGGLKDALKTKVYGDGGASPVTGASASASAVQAGQAAFAGVGNAGTQAARSVGGSGGAVAPSASSNKTVSPTNQATQRPRQVTFAGGSNTGATAPPLHNSQTNQAAPMRRGATSGLGASSVAQRNNNTASADHELESFAEEFFSGGFVSIHKLAKFLNENGGGRDGERFNRKGKSNHYVSDKRGKVSKTKLAELAEEKLKAFGFTHPNNA